MRVAVGLAVFAVTLGLIMVRPRGLSEALTAPAGAVAMLLLGDVTLAQTGSVLAGQWNIFGFFLGLMVIAALAEQAGIFEAMAYLAARWSGGSARRLYIVIFLVGVVITTFLANDATALILTPVVFALVSRLRLPVLPFMFACTFIADSASYLLPVSNPINIIVLDAFGGGLATFLHYLLLPALLSVGWNVLLFVWLFRDDLRGRFDARAVQAPELPPQFRVTVALLGVIAVAYVIGSLARAPLSLVALGGAVLLLAGTALAGQLSWLQVRDGISWSLFGFVAGMFVVVRAVENLGVTHSLGAALARAGGGGPVGTVLVTTLGTGLGANLINNVPMALVMTSTLPNIPATPTTHQALVYATIFGADLGPNLTTVGSLATMLWLVILRRKGLDIATRDYVRLGVVVVLPLLIVCGLLIATGW